jgi:hypothetical protein
LEIPDTIHATNATMKIRGIAERLQQDLIGSPREKPKKVRKGNELEFVRGFLHDWGYDLPGREIQNLAAKAKTYEVFMKSATK